MSKEAAAVSACLEAAGFESAAAEQAAMALVATHGVRNLARLHQMFKVGKLQDVLLQCMDDVDAASVMELMAAVSSLQQFLVAAQIEQEDAAGFALALATTHKVKTVARLHQMFKMGKLQDVLLQCMDDVDAALLMEHLAGAAAAATGRAADYLSP